MISRRSLVSALALSRGVLAAAAPTRIIDTHIHLYDPGRPEGVPWPRKDEAVLYRRHLAGDYRRAVEGLGVTGAIIIEASPWLEDNQWILDRAKEDPLIVGVVGRLEPGKPEFARHLERLAADGRFLGIRLGVQAIVAGLDQPAFLADMRRLSGRSLSLDAIGGPELLPAVQRLSDKVQDLRIIIDHLPFAGATGAALETLKDRRLVFAKVSGVLRKVEGKVSLDLASYRGYLDELWSAFGPDRLVYGSNWPVSNLLAAYPDVLRLVREYFSQKSGAAVEGYFWKNSQEFYRWKQRSNA